MRHSCDVGEEDMEYMVRATGAYGEEAREMLKTFIREEQDKHWGYVEDEDPCPVLKSVVIKPNTPARRPRPRKERDLSPASLGEPEPISLEEPPAKVRCVETVSSASLLLDELACSPTLSSGSSYEEASTVTVNINNDKETEIIHTDSRELSKKEAAKRKESDGIKEINSERDQQAKKLKTIEKPIEKLPEGVRHKQNVTETQNENDKQRTMTVTKAE